MPPALCYFCHNFVTVTIWSEFCHNHIIIYETIGDVGAPALRYFFHDASLHLGSSSHLHLQIYGALCIISQQRRHQE